MILSSKASAIKMQIFKNEGIRVLTRFFPIISIWKFFNCSRAANPAAHGRIVPKIQTRPRFYKCAKMKKIRSKTKALEW